jgi:hypothetical protein
MNRIARNSIGWLAVMAASVSGVGCGGRQSAQQQMDAAFQQSGAKKEAVYPLAGKVRIDGQTPKLEKKKQRLIVILYDPAQPNLKPSSRPQAMCNSEGEFSFHSYAAGDGVLPGKYVLVFVQLSHNKRKGYIGPDGLKNLFNDPEKNAAKFTIDHQAPGKNDYDFDLGVAGHEPGTPGPKTITQIDE